MLLASGTVLYCLGLIEVAVIPVLLCANFGQGE
jgi:hypothetical protein